MSPLTLMVLSGLPGHMTLWVINTRQCCRLKGELPREQRGATGLALLTGTSASGFRLKCNADSYTPLPPRHSGEMRHTLYVHMCGCVSPNKRQSHRFHCCDPAPGAGRQSRAPPTGGSTISHSSADGPVYSATQGDTARVSRRQRMIPH